MLVINSNVIFLAIHVLHINCFYFDWSIKVFCECMVSRIADFETVRDIKEKLCYVRLANIIIVRFAFMEFIHCNLLVLFCNYDYQSVYQIWHTIVVSFFCISVLLLSISVGSYLRLLLLELNLHNR